MKLISFRPAEGLFAITTNQSDRIESPGLMGAVFPGDSTALRRGHKVSNLSAVTIATFFPQAYFKNKLKLAFIGQSLFVQQVYSHLQKEGHRVVGVVTVPDKDGKADSLDDGLDTGPILLQRSCDVKPNDTVDALYNRFLFLEGIKAVVEAIQLIADGKAPRIPQPEEGVTYEGIQKKENAENEYVYMATKFEDFIQMVVRKLRGDDQEMELVVDYVSKEVNEMIVKMPYQCFINGQFVDAEDGETYDIINPTDGSGATIPINQACPNHNLTFTKKEPLGACAIIIPWNYPLMMLTRKSTACLAAGNALVLKLAQTEHYCPDLTVTHRWFVVLLSS
ncbi:hypothetical protein STEG23_018307 [Scotinomys teguina]